MSLSPIFLLKASILRDERLGAEHYLQPEARIIAAELAESVPVRILFDKHGSTSVTDILGFLNQAGALVRYRPPSLYLRLLLQVVRTPYMWLRYPALVHRKPFAAKELFRATLLATWPLFASSGFVALLAVSSGLASAAAVFTAGGVGLVVFAISLLAHEAAHALVIRHHGVVDIMYAPLRLRMVHRRQSPAVEAYSAVAGPIAGSLACLFAGLAGVVVGKPGMLWICLAIAGFHLISLLPWYGDGASLKNAWYGAHA